MFNLGNKLNYFREIIVNYKDWYLIFFNRFFGIHTKKIHLRNGIYIEGGLRNLIVDLVDESFIKEVYNPKFMRIHRADIVMDIGSNVGVFSLYAAARGAKKIYSIEPLPQNILLLKKNLRNNYIQTTEVIENAISGNNEKRKLYVGNLYSNSLMYKHPEKQLFFKYVVVKSLRLQDVFKIYKIRKLDFLKVDCEGGEGEIISSSRAVLNKINKIAIEYHDNVSVLSHDEIANILINYGFKVRLRKTDDMFGYIYAWRT